ncbi:MAG: alkaline phosphatase family protein [Planctomycetota bacterium]|nr:MAG: alkaline phosphatase family protein [Planctomycetota bacterium]
MVGEVTTTSALAQVRLTATDRLVGKPFEGDVPGSPGVVEFELFEIAHRDDTVGRSVARQRVAAVAAHDFIARASFQGLKPHTHYLCRTRIGSDDRSLAPGPAARFRTLPGPQAAVPVRFVVVTGMNYAKFHGDPRIDRKQHVIENNTELPPPYSGPDKHLGYPALEAIRKLRPDFFVGTGDNVYYDTPDKPRAKTIPQLRRKWHEQFVQPRYRQLFAVVPTYWEIDDHDYRYDDCDNTGDYEPSPATGRRMMLEQLPVAPMDDKQARTYRTYRVSRDLQVWFVENRMYRSPNAMPDGPEKSIWGRTQRAWLQRTLEASDATFKLLISPTPMIGPDDLRKKDNHCDIGGFRHERDSFFAWLRETGIARRGFFIVCGDRHWQYHSIDPTGIEEFSCGALVDANARPARRPGDPAGTDPQGRIKQPYYSDPPTGGFLLVESTPAEAARPARLTMSYFDEKGKLLHRVEKLATDQP